MEADQVSATIDFRRVNGVQLECAIAGDVGNPLVILLHGFPDLWHGWRFQIPQLVAAGFRVISPNQRGYGKSDKPRPLSAYDIEELAKDVVELAESEGNSAFHLVGHDWGGIVAWWVAARFAQCVSRVAILNAPHPGIFASYVCGHPSQVLKSWYTAFFQLPWLPEAMLSARNYELLFRTVKGTSRKGVFGPQDRAAFVDGWSEPGALTAMLNYYRAMRRRSSKSLQLKIVSPTLILMSDRDPTEEAGLATASSQLCDSARIEWITGAAHWIQREEPERVTAELIKFLTAK
ncbi:alpha/beta fold hydrolase [Anatilimnocola floriformis]|uniref:alpha/beta fold hydrolase n=1 Tax=Anatilimnocola floriformis TaxID=2948575 RepID=UPI0020C3A48A|nr:alpha/beta hydrolase [Anatilimnocola floriformis]